MKNILLISFVVFLTLLYGCGSKTESTALKEDPVPGITSITLFNQETVLCDSLGFDKTLATKIKEQTGSSLNLIPQPDSLTGEITKLKGKGLCALSTSKENDQEYILNHKEEFLKNGYLLFSYSDDLDSKEYVAMIKGSDDLDIIKWRKTDGINHGHTNTDVLKRFKNWKERNDFWVFSIGRDFVEIRFKNEVRHVELFAKEVYEFCPDAIDQGAGDMKTLVEGIKEMNGMFFWWD
ncbi:MAG: conserved hypothetical cytosolic protein [Bacteroidetes bacterium]|jgi:hypothetical protein|nr:conserved hypothetical cytosolic protein [Bacteroidota bacterium]